MTVDPAVATLATLAVWVFCCIACPVVAESKGWGALGWFLLGALFGPLAFLLIWAMAPQQTTDMTYNLGLPRLGTYMRKVCPWCLSSIHADARVCRYCHREVPAPPEALPVGKRPHGTCPRCGMRFRDPAHDVRCRS